MMRPAAAFQGCYFLDTPGKGPLSERHARRHDLAKAAIADSRVALPMRRSAYLAVVTARPHPSRFTAGDPDGRNLA